MAQTTARKVANLILVAARDRHMEISNLKLQKLLYYCQAWYLAALDFPLFSERIEAWIHGPVVPPVFGDFKVNRWRPIDLSGVITEPIEDGDPRWPVHDLVIEVMNAYGDMTGPELEALTHNEEPWKIARNGIPSDEPSTSTITHQSMRAFYSPQLMSTSE